jgi:hypothetical protein
MSDFTLEPGDLLCITAKRKTVIKGASGEEDREETQTYALSEVRCPDRMKVIGGSVQPEWDKDQQFLVIRLKGGVAD